MKYISIRVFFYSMLFLFACNDSVERKYTRESKIFNEYLQQVDTVNSNANDCYILIADAGCHGCIDKVISSLKNYSNCAFIVSEDAFHRYILPEKDSAFASKIIIDKTGKINRLSFHGGNVGIVITSSSLVDTIITIEPPIVEEQLSAVFTFLNK